MPLVDEFIVNVPRSDDKTLEVVCSIGDPKIKILETNWEGNIPSGGKILSHHTNLALKRCTGDWCFYIQADEVIHEDDHEKISSSMRDNLSNEEVDGLLFDYVHFYGSYSCRASARNWYRKEVRIIRNGKNILSYADAQGFRYSDNSRVKVAYTGARIFHYGWVRPLESMRAKTIAMDRLWHGEKFDDRNKNLGYKAVRYGLRQYKGTHPSVMRERIKNQNWHFDFRSKITSYREFRYWLSDLIEQITGLRLFEYKGYRLIK